jgi:hypothetical protein
MRLEPSVWQGCAGDWQPLFIREYWMPLGHIAWQGFLQQGRGLVACQVHGATATLDWRLTPIDYTARFLNLAEAREDWSRLGMPIDAWSSLETALAAYDPTQDAVLLLAGDGQPYLSCLRGWAVSPPECSRQMGDRQAEFSRPSGS